MKRFLLLALLSLLLVALSSCSGDDVSWGRKACRSYLEQCIDDPSSLVIYSEKYEEDGAGSFLWTLDVGFANAFGGMVRHTVKIETTRMPGYLVDEGWNDGHRFDVSEDGEVMGVREYLDAARSAVEKFQNSNE